MFDMEKINNLTTNDVIIINGLVDLAKEAKEAAKLIRDTYSFKIGEEKTEVWSDGNNAEYVTHTGFWIADYLHQTYSVECSEDEIFKLFRDEYLIENGFAEEYSKGSYWTDAGKNKHVCGYFRHFLKVTRQKYEEQCNK